MDWRNSRMATEQAAQQQAKGQPPEFYERDFQKQGFDYYSSGHYRLRNVVFAEMIKRLQPRSVFEFAGAEGDLAELILKTCQSVEQYDFSDFTASAVEHTAKRLSKYGSTRHTCVCLDIDKEWRRVQWGKYDLVVSTALEHVVHDLQIVECIPRGCRVALCLPAMKWEGHVRAFQDWKAVRDRYPTLRFIDAVGMTFSAQDYNKKYMFTAEKR